MFKSVKNRVWAFDAEWIPDPLAGRLLYKLSAEMSDREVVEVMWKKGGATEEDPTPYLKTVLCRIVSVAAVERHRLAGLPVAATWDAALQGAMTDADIAIAEEAVADELLEDLTTRRPAPRSPSGP